jgi:hypothetical protein
MVAPKSAPQAGPTVKQRELTASPEQQQGRLQHTTLQVLPGGGWQRPHHAASNGTGLFARLSASSCIGPMSLGRPNSIAVEQELQSPEFTTPGSSLNQARGVTLSPVTCHLSPVTCHRDRVLADQHDTDKYPCCEVRPQKPEIKQPDIGKRVPICATRPWGVFSARQTMRVSLGHYSCTESMKSMN